MQRASILLALISISLWSFVAYLASSLTSMPAILLVGTSLLVGSLVGVGRIRDWFISWKVLAVGLLGYFIYHLLLFSAFHYAPAIEVSLMNYLWPLLIVVLAPLLLKDHPLRGHHLLGAGLGFAGAALIVSGGRLGLDAQNLRGYLLAGGAGVAWACYSLLTKRLPPFPTAAVAGFCLVSGVLSLGLFSLNPDALQIVRGVSLREWLLVLLIGLGPNGIAFYAWDAAIKRGDPRVIGSLSYLTPLLAMINLVWLGRQSFTWVSAAAMALILLGAALGTLGGTRKSRV